MQCQASAVCYLSCALLVGGVAYLLHQLRAPAAYGRYTVAGARTCPAARAWFVQELPAFALPLLLLLLPAEGGGGAGGALLLCPFLLHYFHRTFVFSLLSRGRPVPVHIVLSAAVFNSTNGVLQGHRLLHCPPPSPPPWAPQGPAAGLLLFLVGLVINIHSDHILRRLRKPGETVYRIPHGGMFELVSGANFFGEIVEWCGYAVATWSLPAFAFAFFTICSIGPRAYQHHRDYLQRFEDYPVSRKALIPFIL